MNTIILFILSTVYHFFRILRTASLSFWHETLPTAIHYIHHIIYTSVFLEIARALLYVTLTFTTQYLYRRIQTIWEECLQCEWDEAENNNQYVGWIVNDDDQTGQGWGDEVGQSWDNKNDDYKRTVTVKYLIGQLDKAKGELYRLDKI